MRPPQGKHEPVEHILDVIHKSLFSKTVSRMKVFNASVRADEICEAMKDRRSSIVDMSHLEEYSRDALIRALLNRGLTLKKVECLFPDQYMVSKPTKRGVRV